MVTPASISSSTSIAASFGTDADGDAYADSVGRVGQGGVPDDVQVVVRDTGRGHVR